MAQKKQQSLCANNNPVLCTYLEHVITVSQNSLFWCLLS